jgi:nicotinamide-nucleotide amidase
VNAEIIAVGSELLTPFRSDTNSLYLTEQLNQLGVEVIFKSIVGDHLPRLVAAAQHALFRSDIVIFSGGLGPTEDDLTREAVAEALGVAVRRDAEILTKLEERFAARGWKMAANNAKQADVLEGATVLPNANGTAPGQWLSGNFDGREHIIVLLPGPPFELKALFDTEVRERLRAKIPTAYLATRVLKIAMLGESQVDARVSPIYKRFADVDTTILAGAGEVQLHFTKRAESLELAQRRVDEVAGAVEDELDDAVFSRNGESLEQIGAVVYSNELKTEFAGVPREMIERHGAVSREVAAALAEGIRYRCEASLGVGITGVAGPTGGTPDKPVGLVFHAVASDRGTEVIQRNLPGDRKRIRWFSSTMALDMERRNQK